MLVSRRLDDQSFSDIVSEAMGRLPWLCPVWTDHNAHDPGITILELMAWYKEMQQYQMDQLTPQLQRRLLELAGVTPLEGACARCGLELPSDTPPRRRLERLVTPQGVSFELLEGVPEDRPRLERMVILQGGQRLEITSMVQDGLSVQPFRFGAQQESALALGFDRPGTGTLRLWFQVDPPAGVPRNPADDSTPPPRTLAWKMEGAGRVEPVSDGTWCLSWSGYVTLPVPRGWQAGEDGLYWLELRLERAGCEEQPRLSGLSAGRVQAAQQESRVRSYLFQVQDAPGQQVLLDTAQAQQAKLAVFLRRAEGWEQTDQYQWERIPQGRLVTADASGAVLDGEENLLVVCIDPEQAGQLLLTTLGQPGEELYLNVGEQHVLPGHLKLMCLTLCEDGQIRPAPWRWVEDLSVCAPRDRAFTFDPVRQTILFGDGLHGAIPAAGEGSVLVSELVLSLCGGGNVPAHAGLAFPNGEQVDNQAAEGGRDPERLSQAQGRLLVRLSGTQKCLSAQDYAQRARETPGLRVAGARALPGYDPGTPNLRRHATVTVAVLPAGEDPYPIADEWFLAAVDRQLARCRTVCIQTRAARVRYVPFALTVQLRLEPGGDEQAVRRALEEWFKPREERIGAPVVRNELTGALQKLPGVLRLLQLELRGLDQNSYKTAAGDLELPPDAIARLELSCTQVLLV